MIIKLVSIILALFIVGLANSNLVLLIKRNIGKYYLYIIIEKAIYK